VVYMRENAKVYVVYRMCWLQMLDTGRLCGVCVCVCVEAAEDSNFVWVCTGSVGLWRELCVSYRHQTCWWWGVPWYLLASCV